jgi:hypothetical protein
MTGPEAPATHGGTTRVGVRPLGLDILSAGPATVTSPLSPGADGSGGRPPMTGEA